MKITHVILTSRFAGSERYAIELANAQSKTHEVSIVISPQAAKSEPQALLHRIDSAVKVYILSNRLPLFQIFEVRRLLKKINPDIAHGHLSTACRALSNYSGASKRVATLHIYYKKQQHEKLDGLIAIAPWQLADIPDQLLKHTTQIDNWTANQLAEPDQRELLRMQYGVKPTDILIGALGRTVESKGFEMLIKAFKQSNIPNARLAIIGSGKDWTKLKALADSSIIMPGFSTSPENWLAAFDVFVSSAKTEPFGLVFLEAMNSGLPIISTESKGAKHLHHLIKTALIPIDDAQKMSDAMKSFCSHPVARTHYDLSQYRIESKIIEIEAFYKKLLS